MEKTAAHWALRIDASHSKALHTCAAPALDSAPANRQPGPAARQTRRPTPTPLRAGTRPSPATNLQTPEPRSPPRSPVAPLLAILAAPLAGGGIVGNALAGAAIGGVNSAANSQPGDSLNAGLWGAGLGGALGGASAPVGRAIGGAAGGANSAAQRRPVCQYERRRPHDGRGQFAQRGAGPPGNDARRRHCCRARSWARRHLGRHRTGHSGHDGSSRRSRLDRCADNRWKTRAHAPTSSGLGLTLRSTSAWGGSCIDRHRFAD